MFKKLLSFIFPKKCIFCGEILDPELNEEICFECGRKIPFINGNKSKILFEEFRNKHCEGLVCVCEYSGIIKKSLINYKFFNKPGYYRTFSCILSQKLKEMTDCTAFDIIVSVPLHRTRENLRGYNQSRLISREISRKINVPDMSFVLKRIENTKTQSLLSKSLRKSNVRGAFRAIHADLIREKTILLVDDILTTGSTIEECCKVLKESGANKIIAAVVATGRKNSI